LNEVFVEGERPGRDDVVRMVRQRAPLVAAAALVTGLAVLAVSSALPAQYRATAEVFVAPVAGPTVALQEVILGQNLAHSYVQLATAEVVLRPAMQKVGWTDLVEFGKRTSVSQVLNTFVINISFDLDDPAKAAAAANAIAESFVTQSRTVQTALQGTVSVWQPATAPQERESPRILLNTVVGALAGGFLGLFAISGFAYLDDRVKDIDRVRRRLGISPLVEVPRSMQPQTMVGKLFVRDSPHSAEAEAFRSLRTNITFANVDARPRSILVTSALPSEGKSVVSANLALAMAYDGTPTVLVDADLRRPSQHVLFGLKVTSGLTSLLSGQVSVEILQRFRVSEHLLVIPSGPLPPNPADLLSSVRMTELIDTLAGLAEGCTVIIDASPVMAVADPLALSTKVDGCVLVIDAAHTNARDARRAIQRLAAVNAKILGAVLNKTSTASSHYGYKYESGDEGPMGDLRATTNQPGQEAGRPSGAKAGDRSG
jgi:capsular exopolysaccharide synthesis family protein